MNSTRRLLGENEDDFERSDEPVKDKFLKELPRKMPPQITIDNLSVENVKAFNNATGTAKGKRIKDIFPMQVEIDGLDDDADDQAKYLFIEDKHAIGDLDLLDNEAFKGENHSFITTFIVLFLIIACSSAICCYLNYTFSRALS